MDKMKIDFETIVNYYYKDRKVDLENGYALESAMKEAVQQSIPLILQQVRANLWQKRFNVTDQAGNELIVVELDSVESITGLEDEIKKQLGL